MGEKFALPEGARPRELRVRAGERGRRAGGRGGKIKTARVALGGVAHKPWRAKEAEEKLVGEKPGEATFKAAAHAALADAKGYKYNTFKIELARRSIVRALNNVMAA